MPGITGVLNLDSRTVNQADLTRMTSTLSHRGPDGDGVHVSGMLGLGHTRLSITDPTRYADQPMTNKDQSIWITFDGRLYNVLELRSHLEASGHRFRSESDAELVLYAYQEHGLGCLQKLDGVFAFALWDDKLQRLWLVRDRLGAKPLFYTTGAETLLFGSEIKAILAHPGVHRQVDFDALSMYLSLGYLPAPHTLFKGIHQLLPAEFLTISPENPRPALQTYWDPPYPMPRFSGSLEEASEALSERLEGAVRRCVTGKLAPGALLHGGLNATATAVMMTRMMDQPVRTFSIAFQGQPFNELPYARRVSQWLNTRHTEQMLSLQLVKSLPTIIWHAEEPTTDPAMLPLFYLSQLARTDVKVVVSGDGGDELFSGYPIFTSNSRARLLRNLPRTLDATIPLPPRGYLSLNGSSAGTNGRGGIFSSQATMPWQRGQNTGPMFFSEKQKDEIVALEARQQWDPHALQHLLEPYLTERAGCHLVDQVHYIETRFHLPNNLLLKIDRMSMAHGLEVRIPMLDATMLTLAASLPPELKVNHKEPSTILELAMTKHLPGSLIEHDGAGQGMPLTDWLSGSVLEYTYDMLSPASVRDTGFLAPDAVQSLVDDHQAGRAEHSSRLWGLLMLMVWWKVFFKQN